MSDVLYSLDHNVKSNQDKGGQKHQCPEDTGQEYAGNQKYRSDAQDDQLSAGLGGVLFMIVVVSTAAAAIPMVMVVVVMTAAAVLMMVLMVMTTAAMLMVMLMMVVLMFVVMVVLMIMDTAAMVVVMMMMIVLTAAVLMMLVLVHIMVVTMFMVMLMFVLMAAAGFPGGHFLFYLFHLLVIPFLHDVLECHGKNLSNVGVIQRIVNHAPLFPAFYDA